MAMLRLLVASLLALNAKAIALQAAPAPAAAGAPGAPGAPGGPEIQYSKEFEKDWHNEWKQGDFPSWKKVIKVDGIEKFEDRQSDGVPGFLQKAAPAPAAAGAPGAPGAPGGPEIQYSKKFEDDWHNEWKQGDYPSWKKVIKVDGIKKFEDRQSDGIPGLLQTAAAPAPAAAGAPGAPGAPGGPEIQYSKQFEDDWHNEWKQGDYPSWKKVIKVDGIEKFEDRQSDGIPGLLQSAAAPAPAAAGAPGAPGAPGGPEIQYSKQFEDDWHNEWKQGDYPSWKKVIKVDGIEKFQDRQSDGVPGF